MPLGPICLRFQYKQDQMELFLLSGRWPCIYRSKHRYKRPCPILKIQLWAPRLSRKGPETMPILYLAASFQMVDPSLVFLFYVSNLLTFWPCLDDHGGGWPRAAMGGHGHGRPRAATGGQGYNKLSQQSTLTVVLTGLPYGRSVRTVRTDGPYGRSVRTVRFSLVFQ